MQSTRTYAFVLRVVVVTSLLGLGCGSGTRKLTGSVDGSSSILHPDAGTQVSRTPDVGSSAPRGDAGTIPPQLDGGHPTIAVDASRPTAQLDAASAATRVDAGHPTVQVDAAKPTVPVDAAKPTAPVDAAPPATPVDAGHPITQLDAGHASADAMTARACGLPAVPANVCAAVPTATVTPCTQTGGQPSQTGYLEIDSPGHAPTYVCATSWSADPAIGYIFGQPGTFMSNPQSCCGGPLSAVAGPTAPALSIGSLGTPHIPSHIKPPEIAQTSSGPLRQNPFAIVVTDAQSGAAATQAMATWLSWGGDGKTHAPPGGTGSYTFAAGFPINYVVIETSDGLPVIVIGPEVSLTPDGLNPLGHPTLGACPAGGGAPLGMVAGQIQGTTIDNQSGRYNYGPSATPQTLETAAALFNCLGIRVTDTKYYKQ